MARIKSYVTVTPILMVPAVLSAGRHHADIRWTGILQNSGLYDDCESGENEWEIPSDQWELNELTEIPRLGERF